MVARLVASLEEARIAVRFESSSEDFDSTLHYGFVAALRPNDEMFAVQIVAQTVGYFAAH